MDFFKELFGADELFSFFEKIAGTLPMVYDFLFLVLGTYLLQRIIRGKATLLLIIVMSIFVIIIHYNATHTLYEAVIRAYEAKGIGFFRQEIFLGAIVLFFALSGRLDTENDTLSQIIPVFVMIESINILYAVGDKTASDQWPFWVILIFMLIYLGISFQSDIDHKIEQKILNGNASDSDHAYWVKRKREKEREEQWQQQQYYNNDTHF